MKKALLTAITVLFIINSTGIGWASPIKVTVYGEDEYPPYSYRDGREIKGIYHQILTEAFSRMEGYDVRIDVMPWKRMIGELEKGRIFAAFAPYKVDTRPWMIYSKPILEEKVVAFGLKSKVEGKKLWPEDFYGSKVGITMGYDLEVLFGKKGVIAIGDGKLESKRTMDNATNLFLLRSGKIDLYLNDSLTDLGDLDKSDDPVVIAAEVGSQWGYVGFTSNLEDFPFVQDFKDKFDGIIEDLRGEGFIDRILEEHTKKSS
nr:transporter substrate-binding domain-containing protein [uncultured Dethiosulfovibrio sp.]